MRQLFRRITAISVTCALAVSAAAAVAVAAEPTTGNILTGKLPTTNSTHLIGDGDTGFDPTDSNITKIIAGEENGSAENNGYASWDDVYLQYDFGEPREIHSINLYRNGYENALNTFKRIKVEVSSNEDFSGANVLFGTADVEETAATKLAAQTINLTTPVTARYVRIWQKGHCIQNTNFSWKGYSNGVGLREIEVIAKLKDGGTLPGAQETRNIALGKLPYVYGLAPTNIAAISDGKQDDNYAVHNSTGERWLQFEYKNRYRIHEVVLKLKPGTYPLVRIGVSSTPTSAGKDVDGLHSRPMFPILETQVGDGWVGDVDYTKQDSNFLVDWVRVCQSEGQPVTRFDDLDGAESGAYRIAPASRTEGLTTVSNGDAAWQNKNNFFYGGQPRYETSRLMRVADATGEQPLTYKVPGVRDVHLTAYYQTSADKTVSTSVGNAGWSIRKSLVDGANIDFRVQTSTDDSAWQDFNGVKVVDNLIEVHPGYARTTFDAVGLPEGGAAYVRVVFPELDGVRYETSAGARKVVSNTDVQLAKVTFLQERSEDSEPGPDPTPDPDPDPDPVASSP